MGLDSGGLGGRSRVLAGAATGSSAQRDRMVAVALIVCPLISGLFFGLVSVLLVYPSGGAGHALEVGAVVGGAMFAANAAALCIVQSTGRSGAQPALESPADDISEARAS